MYPHVWAFYSQIVNVWGEQIYCEKFSSEYYSVLIKSTPVNIHVYANFQPDPGQKIIFAFLEEKLCKPISVFAALFGKKNIYLAENLYEYVC